MAKLPVIVGFGGVNSAGRSSFHHSFRRLVADKLETKQSAETYLDLAVMMGLLKFDQGKFLTVNGEECSPEEVTTRFGKLINENTLLREINSEHFDINHVPVNKKINAHINEESGIKFTISKKELPNQLPDNWKIHQLDENSDKIEIVVRDTMEFYQPDSKEFLVKTAGQLPTGFDPGKLYNSRKHPRGLKMSTYGVSDAISSMGIDWETIRQAVRPDQIGVYAGSGHGQMDEFGGGGLMQALLRGQRTTSRHLPLSLVDMPSNFVNAYVIGNVGHTGTQKAACATFLYNLELAVKEIRLGNRRVAIIGNTEAPIIPELMEGYKAMNALADDNRLMHLFNCEKLKHEHRMHSCRPFGENCGFTLSESSQYAILFDDELAIELGAQIFGSIGDIFIKADGFKKSISSPGFGNYITLAKAAAMAKSIIGTEGLRHRTFISAHGSGTPLNRSTESHGLNETAKAFNINSWPVSAIKCYVGHPLTPASGDQLIFALGTWKYGLIPGIFTLDQIADDVHQDHLRFSQDHLEVDADKMDAAFLNSKGFGGNNATGLILSPQFTFKMLEKKHGKKALKKYQALNESVLEKANQYDLKAIQGRTTVIYKDSEKVLDENDLNLNEERMKIPGYDKTIDLKLKNPYPEMDIL